VASGLKGNRIKGNVKRQRSLWLDSVELLCRDRVQHCRGSEGDSEAILYQSNSTYCYY